MNLNQVTPQGGSSFSVHPLTAVPEESAVVVYFEDEALDQTVADPSTPAPDRQAS